VLRVLGNLLGLAGFEYLSSEEIRDELKRELDSVPEVTVASAFIPGPLASLDATRSIGLYAGDAVVRRSTPLQQTREGRAGARGGAA
jgi:NADH-quinone oxidoreductase subunit G